MVQSFDVRPLQLLKQYHPALRLGLLIEDKQPPGFHLDKLGFIPFAYNPQYTLLDEDVMQLAHRLGMKVFAWTVNDLEAVQSLAQIGVDGIITDYPHLVLDYLKNTVKSL
jgi:glycerophosphoryl diester phosphodiesterase